MTVITVKAAREKLMTLQKKLAAYYHAAGLINYDGATTAPKKTAENRAATLSVLSEEIYKLGTSQDTVDLLEFLDAFKAKLPVCERRMVHLLLEDIRDMQKIPMDEYIAFEELLVKADDVWHSAKLDSDFEAFRPYLEKIFETKKRFAGYLAPDKKPYEYWLGKYEEGLTMEACENFFGKLKERIVPLLARIAERPQVDDSIRSGNFPAADQEKLSYYLMDLEGLDSGHVGLSTTEHPFTTSLGSHLDTRITTHYHEDDFVSSMYSVLHEGGHALYETGVNDGFAYTALDDGVSMSVHESQSRFYENIIGRSRAFCSLIFPKLCELFPQLESRSAEEFYRAVNKVQPSLIRTEADEVTYSLHVMIRYEIEKAVMAGELEVRDIPAEWNRLYKEYLGVDVPDDRRGCLQDSHWAGGMIGYFPSYALGSAYGAQFLAKMQETVDVYKCVESGDLSPVNAWNRDHIWQYGKLYPPVELIEKVFGAPFDPEFYVSYLENKCIEIYGL